MKKVWIAISIAAILAVGVGIWFFFVKDDSLDVSTKSVDTSQTESIKESDTINGEWKIQKQDDVFAGYEIQELFGGEAAKKTASGKSSEVSGSMTIEDDTVTQAIITVDMTTLASDSSRRDSRMENEGLEINDFPEATFTLTESANLGAVEKNKDTTVSLTGELELHGVKKEVTIPITAKWNGKVIVVSGELAIKLADFEISPPDSSFVKVDDNGSIKFQLLFVPQNS